MIPADNRRLVEGALHPDVTEGLKRTLGSAWINHANAQDGTAMAERALAERWALNLSAPFGSLIFPDGDETIATRLGTRDRLVDFEPSFAGPFGQMVERLTIPGWMSGAVPTDAIAVVSVSDSEGTSFRLGERGFHYGRWGLEAVPPPR